MFPLFSQLIDQKQETWINYRVSQKKVPTFENSYQQEYFTDLNGSNSS